MQVRLTLTRGAAVTAGVCAATAAAIAAAVAGPSTAAPAAHAAAACRSARLVVWLNQTHGGGTAGGTYYNLEFTNLSAQPCRLSGYPGVSAIGLAGGQLGSAARRNAAHAAAAITLASGSGTSMAGTTATVVLKITDVGVYSPSSCRPVTAAGLRVYPPGETASETVPYPFRGCSRSGPSFLTIEAVQKGVPTQ